MSFWRRYGQTPSSIAQATAGAIAMLAAFAAVGFARVNWPDGLLAVEALAVLMLLFWLVLLGRIGTPSPKNQSLWSEISFGLVISMRALGMAIVLALLIAIFLVGPSPLDFVDLGRPIAFGLIVLLIMVPPARIKIRRRRAALVLGYIEQATRLNLPLSPMLAAAAQSENGALRGILFDLHDRLEAGAALDAALLSVPELPLASIRAIRAGQQVHRLGHALARLNEKTEEPDFSAQHNNVYKVYPILLLFVIVCVMTFVLPRFKVMFAEFHVLLPWTTRMLGGISSYLGDNFAAIAVIAAVLLSLWAAIFRGGRYFPSLGDLRDRILILVPVMRDLARDRALADLCDFVADAIGADATLDTALRQAAVAQGNAIVRQRTIAWADGIAMGQSVCDAARAARMPAAIIGGLSLTRDTDDLVGAMTFLSQYYESRYLRTRAMIDSLFVPGVVFAMGLCVAFVSVAMFQPLAKLDSWLPIPLPGGF